MYFYDNCLMNHGVNQLISIHYYSFDVNNSDYSTVPFFRKSYQNIFGKLQKKEENSIHYLVYPK